MNKDKQQKRGGFLGYARVSKTDGSQSLDLQRDALRAEGVDPGHVYHDFASGVRDDRPGLDNCVRALRTDDVLVVWKLDRLGRNLTHLVNTAQDLAARGVGLRVLAGQGGNGLAACHREASLSRLRTAGREPRSAGRRAAPDQRARLDDAERCVPGHAD